MHTWSDLRFSIPSTTCGKFACEHEVSLGKAQSVETELEYHLQVLCVQAATVPFLLVRIDCLGVVVGTLVSVFESPGYWASLCSLLGGEWDVLSVHQCGNQRAPQGRRHRRVGRRWAARDLGAHRCGRWMRHRQVRHACTTP